jgi:hypothetical protein
LRANKVTCAMPEVIDSSSTKLSLNHDYHVFRRAFEAAAAKLGVDRVPELEFVAYRIMSDTQRGT